MKHRKKMVVAAAIAATVMQAASGASACSFLGKFQVTGDAAAGGGTVTVNGRDTWIGGANRAATWTRTQHVDSTIAKASRNNGTVTIYTGPADPNLEFYGVTAGTKLPQYGSGEVASGTTLRNYRVKFYNSTDPVLGPGYSTHENWSTDCMSSITDRGNDGYNIINNTGYVASPFAVVLGNVTVNGNGEIDNVVSGGTFDVLTKTATFNLPGNLRPDTAPTESAVCVSDNAAYYGNQAPLTIV